jgi:phosphotransferase system enzyme I (PtsI)
MPTKKNIRLTGTSIASGVATGKAFVYRDIIEQGVISENIRADQIDTECEKVQEAAKQVIENLKESASQVEKQIGPYQAEIFSVHQMMLLELIQSHEIREKIERDYVNAETAVHYVFQRWARTMHEEESTRYIQRAQDVTDLGRRLIMALRGISVHPLEAIPEGCVLVAPHLLASDAVFFGRFGVAAIVVEAGAAGSHCALLARQLGIPGVSNVTEATEMINTGDVVLVDGFRSDVIVEPDKKTRKKSEKEMEEYHTDWAKAKLRCHEPAVTKNGIQIPVMANIANRADVQIAVENGADGAGLYRLEALFMLRRTLPTEQELLTEVSDTLALLVEKPVMVRLLDLGSDKNLPYLRFPSEPAPCLGSRGVRLLLSRPELLNMQLRALLRLSRTHNVQIMVPLVTIPEDVQAVRQAVEFQASELGITEIPPLVAMIETPSAALCVPEILRFADVLSLGTNDLAQYAMAAGRQNPLVHHYFRDDAPAVLRLIRLAVKEAGEALVGICGELASQPFAVAMLLDTGVRLLSVAPPLVPVIKEAVRHAHLYRLNRTRSYK